MTNNIALYAYFGEIGIFNDNIPGHSFYQIGLLDSISSCFGIDNFDFYNYLDIKESNENVKFPNDEIGKVCSKYANLLISEYRISNKKVLDNIKDKKYSKIFLKARFRNLSTLTKKLKDTKRFEIIINTALSNGYDPFNIIIIDTDLSLNSTFIEFLNILRVKIIRPSIDIPGIGSRILTDCLRIHKNNINKNNNIVYYGNLDFSNYKEGHSKNQIIFDILTSISKYPIFGRSSFNGIIAAKDSNSVIDFANSNNLQLIPRSQRQDIWNSMKNSLLSINVSKDLYLEKNFIPARIYESIMLGVIPVSYKVGQLEAMSFNTVEDFYEIAIFLSECTPTDYYNILEKIAASLVYLSYK